MYVANYIDTQLFDLQQFTNALNTNPSKLEVFRNALKYGNEVLKSRFRTQMSATDYVVQRAWLVDQILLQAWYSVAWENPDAIALVAVGGYGRGELQPFSDVDVMILLRDAMSATLQSHIEKFVMFLWDIRLEIGHSVRTLAECKQEAANDITVATNLMEARLLVGKTELFQSMQLSVSPEKIWSNQDFFSAKLEEQVKRHHKYHDTAYNLEPNIKESPGGLRDIQTIGWVAKRYFGANTLHDLVQHSFLTEEEYQTLIDGQEFIWRIRCVLHLMAGRREDRILFDYQRALASTFGYHDDELHSGVENFMKRYFRTVMELSSLNEMLLQLFQEAILYADMPVKVYPLNKRFQVHNDFIEVKYDKVFVNYPFALLEIFLLIQQHPEIKGIRASTIRLIRRYKWLIDYAFHQDLRARSLFFEIIRQPRGITQALRLMNSYGILAMYIPAFGKIVGQMQYDLFHVYTVDQHTLFVVRNLRRFSMPEHRHEFLLCSEIMAYLPKPELLYLAGLFHDVAKGRHGDHSQLGEIDAMNFCQAHGLSDYDARLVAWLVRYHLIMSTTAQRQDLSDPDVINAFAQRVEDSTRLDYLYLLTVADIRATNPNLWNSWKDMLLSELYHKTQYVLRHGVGNVINKYVQIQDIQTFALSLIPNCDEEYVTALWEDLGDDYFLRSSPHNIARETQAILNHAQPAVPLVLERQDKQGSTEVIMIYMRDRDYLFAETTYYLEQQGLTVVDAYIVPTQREYTIASYTVLEANGSEINDPIRIESILQGLKHALSRDTSLPFCPINRRIPRQLKHFPVPTRITFTQDFTNDYTVLEIITTDRPGVLSRIAQAFAMCEVRVRKAKIATLGARVEDIFFITDQHNHALYSADQLDTLREQLSSLLDIDMPNASGQLAI